MTSLLHLFCMWVSTSPEIWVVIVACFFQVAKLREGRGASDFPQHTPPFSALTIRIIVIRNICTERNCVARVTNSPSQIAIRWQGQDLDLSCLLAGLPLGPGPAFWIDWACE